MARPKHRCSQCNLKFTPTQRVVGDTGACPWCGAMSFAIVFRSAPCPGMQIFRSFVDDRPTGGPVLYASRKQWLADLHRAGYISPHFEGKIQTDNTGRRPKESMRDFAKSVPREILQAAARARPDTDDELRTWSRRKTAEAKGRAKGS